VRTTVCRCELDEALAARGVGDSDVLYLEAKAGSVVVVVALPADCAGMAVCDSYLGALLQLLCFLTNKLAASNEGGHTMHVLSALLARAVAWCLGRTVRRVSAVCLPGHQSM